MIADHVARYTKVVMVSSSMHIGVFCSIYIGCFFVNELGSPSGVQGQGTSGDQFYIGVAQAALVTVGKVYWYIKEQGLHRGETRGA